MKIILPELWRNIKCLVFYTQGVCIHML